MLPERIVKRFKQRVGGDPDSCWEWPMSVGSHGYGQMGWQESGERFMKLAHRIAWEIAHGPIPTDLTVDHLCRNRRCCNPSHLQLLTNEENGRMNGHYFKTECIRGHAYTPDNTYRDTKGRRCRTCQKAYRRYYRETFGK